MRNFPGALRVRGPAVGEHSLAEDEVDVAAFAHAQADPVVHLGADGAGLHGLLGGSLGGGEQGDGEGAAPAGNRVGVSDRRG
jgi:hypothetical protein